MYFRKFLQLTHLEKRNCVFVYKNTVRTDIETVVLGSLLTISMERFAGFPRGDVRISRCDHGDCRFSLPRPCPLYYVYSPASNNGQIVRLWF